MSIETKNIEALRALAQAAATSLPTVAEPQRRLILAGIVELPIPEAEEAARVLAFMNALAEAQRDFFSALGLPNGQFSPEAAA